jgi:hypothetical protein
MSIGSNQGLVNFSRMGTYKIYLLILSLFAGSSILAQERVSAKIPLVMTDTERRGRSIPVDIYFPLEAGRTDIRYISENGEKYPVICFAHGYIINPDAYSNVRESLVPEGYIMVFPRSELRLFPSHKELALDIVFIINEMERMGNDENSVFFNSIAPVSCAMGHSMGGGSAFVAASIYPGISSLVTLAPYDTRPSAIEAATSVNVPSLIFTGENDCVTSPERYQIPMYDSLASLTKCIIHIKGGNHCQMAGDNSMCRLGESFKGCKPGITMEEQHKIINKYMVKWLNLHLKGDHESGRLFDNHLISDPAIDFSRSGKLTQ